MTYLATASGPMMEEPTSLVSLKTTMEQSRMEIASSVSSAKSLITLMPIVKY